MKTINTTKINNITPITSDKGDRFIEINLEPATDGKHITISLSDASRIAETVNEIYYMEDITSNIQGKVDLDTYAPQILEDKEVLDSILDIYADYRNNADGGEWEETRHWSECLSDAFDLTESEYDTNIALAISEEGVYNPDIYNMYIETLKSIANKHIENGTFVNYPEIFNAKNITIAAIRESIVNIINKILEENDESACDFVATQFTEKKDIKKIITDAIKKDFLLD